jgi:hypothetical protein
MMRESSGGVRMRGLVRVVSGAFTPDAGLRPMQPSSTAKFRSSRQSFKACSPWVPQHQSITGSAHIHLGMEVRDRGSSIEPSVNREGFTVPCRRRRARLGRINSGEDRLKRRFPCLCHPAILIRPQSSFPVDRTGIGSCQDRPMAQNEPEPQESQLGDAVLDAMRGALRILGGMVQMAAGMTRLLAVAVLKAATAAEKVVEASEEDEET